MSEGTAMGLGILLGLFGPLLLLPLIWVVARWPLRQLMGKWAARRFGAQSGFALLGAATVLVAAVVLASYLPGRMQFAQLCQAHAEPVIGERVDVPGFYATKLYSYQADRFLRKEGFAYVEAPDMYKPGRTLRYTLGPDGHTVAKEVPAPTSRYAVSETTHTLGNTLVLTEKRVFELAAGRELARAGSVAYHGGALSWPVLGVFGMADCPNPRDEKGARQFNDYFHLESKVLRSASAPGQ